MARIVLGAKTAPAKKADIVAALEARLADAKAAATAMEDEDEDAGPVRTARTAPTAGKAPQPAGHKGVSFESMTAPPQSKSGVNVDLRSWGTGKTNYSFGEIRRAIEERLAVTITDAHAALEALIDKGVVTFQEARVDLRPPAIEVENHQDQ